MPQDHYLIVLCTFPNPEEARQIGTRLVDLQVAACVNVLPRVESIYRWKGSVTTDAEALAVIKTTATRYPEVEARLREWHPYETPEIIALPIERGSAAYLGWISEATRE